MNGLEKVLKIHGQIHAGDVTWVWDYATNSPRKKSDMTKKEFRAAVKAHKEKGILHNVDFENKISWGQNQ